MKKILVTGGHMTPAVAVMEQLRRRGWRCVYVGRKYALEGDNAEAREYQLMRQHGFAFRYLITGRWQRVWSFQALKSLVKIPVGVIQSVIFLLQEKPDVVLSFGSYVAVPVGFWAWVLRIPLIVHEQTTRLGMANALLVRLATKICVAWPLKYSTLKSKTVFTGNPIRPEIFTIKQKFEIETDKPLIYITGGNLGAHSLNLVFEQILPTLLKKFTVIHQCGNAQKYQDEARLTNFKKNLPAQLGRRYLPVSFVDEAHIGWVFATATLLVGRAGANTVTEVIKTNKPALFIPLPWAGNNEQFHNAQFLVRCQAALILEQKDLTPPKLLQAITEAMRLTPLLKMNLQKLSLSLPSDGTYRMANVIESVA